MDDFGPQQAQSRAILRIMVKQQEKTQESRDEDTQGLKDAQELKDGGGKVESKEMAEYHGNTFK